MFRALRFPAGILSIAIVSNTIEPTRKINPRTEMPIFVINLQSQICNALEKLEPSKKFTRQDWSRSEGGSGTSMILQDGTVFEKAGVNVSRIFGPLPKALEDQMRARKLDGIVCEGLQMFATGISVVIHPVNPNAPTAHLNYRYFELRDQNDKLVTSGDSNWFRKLFFGETESSLPVASWFGGGCDLVSLNNLDS